MKISQQILLILCLLAANSAFAQDPAYISFSVEDGLLSNTITGISQGVDGYIWLSTDLGLVRFDGQDFQNYISLDTLPDTNLAGLYRDLHGKIWLKSSNGRPAYIYGKQIHTRSDTLPFHELGLKSGISCMHVSEGRYYFGTEKDGFTVLQGKKMMHDRAGEAIQQIYHDSEGQVFVVSGNLEEQVFALGQERVLLRTSDRLLLRSGDTTQVLMQQKSKVFREEITDVLVDSRGTLWLVKQGGGIFAYEDFEHEANRKELYWFRDKIINCVFEDREGNLWMGTASQGVILVMSARARTLDQEYGLISEDIHAVTKDSLGRLWMGNSRGQVQMIDQNGTLYTDDISYMLNSYLTIHQIAIDQQMNRWYASEDWLLVKNAEDQLSFLDLYGANDLEFSSRQLAYVANDSCVVSFDLKEDNEVDTLYRGFSNAVSFRDPDELWIATPSGVKMLDGSGSHDYNVAGQKLQTQIVDLQIGDSYKIFLLQGAGALIIAGDKQVHLHASEGLVSDYCTKIVRGKGGVNYLLSNRGFSSIVIENQNVRIRNFTNLDGLASNQVNDVYVGKDTLYVATNRGLTLLPVFLNSEETVLPEVEFKRISIAFRDTLLQEHYELSYDQNNIQLFFSGIAFGSLGQLKYRFRLEGTDDDWVVTSNSQLRYTNLAPGKHLLSVQAINKEGLMSAPKQISFHLSPPIWKTWWFRLALGMLAATTVLGVFYLVLRYQKEKSEFNQRIREGQLMAMRAQMNPHFIFNCLNSIQFFITENDKRSANIYLSLFSDLMRTVLENSKHASISIEDEIASLDLYLQLESLRFSHQFTYDITIDETLDVEVDRIPPMLIQPFAENAIWHGLLPKGSPGKLSIMLERQDDTVKCTITDNGIGRDKAREIQARKRRRHKSAGMENTARRLSMLNQKRSRDAVEASLKVLDLKENGKAKGTQVEVLIPLERD